MAELKELGESLSPNEKKTLPYLNLEFQDLIEKVGLDSTSCLRALQFLSNKKIINLEIKKEKIVDLGVNGILYKKKGLPERRLLEALENHVLTLDEAIKKSSLSDNEFKAALGVLKKKALINLANNKLNFQGRKEEISKKSLEEQFLEKLPKALESLEPEEKHAFQQLKDRKEIISLEDRQVVSYELTELGKKIQQEKLENNLIEELTPEMLRVDSWKGKKFRRYDISSKVPAIFGGKKHIVNQAVEYARKIWTELGFKEMTGTLTQTSFWNFDALYTAQDHPVRELQDTFYIKDVKGKLPDKKILEAVKQSHESGVAGSLGWRYKWQEEDAKKVILRTHTTCLSAKTLAGLRNFAEKRGKFFSVGKCFRNETLDATHEFEFNQTEGIVIDKNANFPQLLGYLKEFFKKMGYEKVRFRPSYFPYTEPSVEIDVFHPFFNKWLELGGAGIFRPEVVIPLLGEYIPVLAWGPGFDRIIMEYYDIHDLRDMYKNDLSQLRKAKVWLR